MAYVAKTFDNLEELTDYLNDVAKGKPLLAGSRVFGLHGLTLIINDGAADRTVTFSDATGYGLLPKEILDQIHATHASLVSPHVGFRNYGHAAPPRVTLSVFTASYAIKNSGTSNVVLGFPVAPAASVTVGANAVVKANIVSVTREEGNRISVLHD